MTESLEPGPESPDRNLALELVRVTEAAALAAARWVGRGDKDGADKPSEAPDDDGSIIPTPTPSDGGPSEDPDTDTGTVTDPVTGLVTGVTGLVGDVLAGATGLLKP